MKTQKPKRYTDDAPLTTRELATARPLRQVFPRLAKMGRRRAKKGEPTKVTLNIRISPEIISYVKSTGPGWQTRIDNVLGKYVEARK